MDDNDRLAERFEEARSHLRSVAYRMLGIHAEAEDAVQQTWLRLSRADTSVVDNLSGWLTTVVSRVCLDMLRSRASRREDPLDRYESDPNDGAADPEQSAVETDSIGAALLVVLDALAPAERLAFVLHDLFAVPFDEIAPIVGRSPAATRQLASRARRRVRGASAESDRARQREVVEAFLAASRRGEFDHLLTLLDPEVVLRADRVAVDAAAAAAATGAPLLAPEVHGARAVATAFSGRAQAARLALVDGTVGAVWAPNRDPRAVIALRFRAGLIVGIQIYANPADVTSLAVTILG